MICSILPEGAEKREKFFAPQPARDGGRAPRRRRRVDGVDVDCQVNEIGVLQYRLDRLGGDRLGTDCAELGDVDDAYAVLELESCFTAPR